MNRKKAKQLRIMLAVMAVTGGYAFQNHAWAAEAFRRLYGFCGVSGRDHSSNGKIRIYF